jgi:hypothetical protein
MKNKLMIVALMVFTLLTTAAFAASNTQTANVPFEFHVGDKVMPAGTYHVSQLTSQTLLIRQDGQKAQQVTLTFPADRTGRDGSPKLVFHKVGDQYFLVQVWGAGTDRGQSILSSSSAERVARNSVAGAVMGSK